MSNEMLIHGRMRKAIRMDMKPFSNVNIMGIITNDDSWVLFSPLPDIIGETAAYSTLYNKRVPILVEVGGKDVTMEFVRKADFLGAAIISEKHQVVYRAPGVWQFVAAGGKPLAGAVAMTTVGAKGETP